MKTTIEMHGFEIVIEETEEGVLTVSASKEGEVVEEFTLEGGEDHPGLEDEEGGEEIQGFEEFGQGEEEDFGDEEGSEEDLESDEDTDEEDLESDEDMDVEDEEDAEEEAQLESFQSFINGSKKKVDPKKRK